MRRVRGRHRSVRLLRKPAVTPAAPYEILREQRRRLGLSVSALASRAHIAQPNLSAMESGKRPIGLAVARKLAKALRVDYRILV
ncbi:MAG: helix-turn-helix transcriptional regulator [Pseudomonadota bacterium]